MPKGVEHEREKLMRFVVALASCYSTRSDYSRLHEESQSLLGFFKEYPVFAEFLSSASESEEKKSKFIRELIRLFAFQQRCLPSTILLLDQFELIGNLIVFLEALIDRLEYLLSFKYIRVHSSGTLNKEQKSKLETSLKNKFGENIKLEYLSSNDMIVGLKLEYDDSILECSLSKKLSEIKKQFIR